ncbi:MAG: type II secretion system F family protein [Candidatus Omnitrophica bacterium]|nr:type II secretion system F family protein [Candidatus Omnitrophota bacterium]
MQNYSYTARDGKGKIVKGFMLAEDEIALANKISYLGYFLTSYKVSKESSEKQTYSRSVKLKPKEIVQLTYQLSTLLDAGLPLLDGLKNLTQDASNERIKKIVDDIRYKIESGGSLKEAMAHYPAVFSKLYQALVGAGESTGNLPETLNDLAQLLEWQMDLRSKIKEAATYPIILFSVMVGVVVLLVVKVIPTFEPMFADVGAMLPLPTQIVLSFSHFIRDFWFLIIVFFAAVFFGGTVYSKTEKGRYNFDSLKLNMPLVGELLRKISLSRFAHTFNICFEAGISLLASLEIAQGTVGNARIEKAIKKATESVNVGEKLGVSLQMTGEFPPMVLRMISVGEQSGALPQTLDKVCKFYDKEVTSTIKSIFALFEPIMIIVMGVVVGGIALAIFLPMFQMAQMV